MNVCDHKEKIVEESEQKTNKKMSRYQSCKSKKDRQYNGKKKEKTLSIKLKIEQTEPVLSGYVRRVTNSLLRICKKGNKFTAQDIQEG